MPLLLAKIFTTKDFSDSEVEIPNNELKKDNEKNDQRN
jgi:hypothetical protein